MSLIRALLYVCLIVLSAWYGSAAASTIAAGSGSSPSDPTLVLRAGHVRALTIEGKTVQGIWMGVDQEGRIVLNDNGKQATFPITDLMLLRWTDGLSTRPASQPAPTSQPGNVMIYLADGSLLPARITGGSARQIEVQAGSAHDLKLPFQALAAVKFAMAADPAGEEALKKALDERDPAQDLLLAVRQGRVTALRGVVESFGSDGGTFKWRERAVPFRPDGTYAIVFGAGHQQKQSAAGAVCVLRDGSAWAGRIVSGDRDQLRVALSGGMEVPLLVSRISEIRFHSDRVLFLSDLKPAEYLFEPFAVTPWPYRMDRSVANRPLCIGEEVFDRGIGMHSQARLSFDVPPGFSKLAATIGIDDAARPRGNVVFRVVADGKEVFASGAVTGRDPPRSVLVGIGGAKRVQLAVDFGAGLDVGDQADWGNVRLIK